MKAALQEAAILYRDRHADIALERAAAKIANFKEQGGTVVELSPAEREAWVKSMPNLAKEWAEKLEAKGVPAKQILADYMDMLREGGAKPVRDWDKE